MSGIATQAAIASGEINARAMAGLASTVTSIMEGARAERAAQVDIMQGMVVSAQNYRKQQSDEYFQTRGLELREKELEMDSSLKNIGLGFQNSRLLLEQRGLDLEERRVAATEKKIADADKYKPYVSGLTKQGISLEQEIKEKTKAYDAERETLEMQIYGRPKSGTTPEVRGMTAFQRLQDEKNPNGKQARLKELQNKAYKDLDEKKVRLDAIGNEINNVNTGGEPYSYLPRPKPTTSRNTSIEGMDDVSREMPSGNSEIDPFLLPKTSWIPRDLSDDQKAMAVLDEEAGRLEGQLPQDEYQDPISPEQEASQIAQQDKEYISYILNPSTRLDEVQEFQAALSPTGKIELNKARNVYATGILTNYGFSMKYDPFNKDASPGGEVNAESVKHIVERYIRTGGDEVSVVSLQAEAEQKLLSINSEVRGELATKDDFNESQVPSIVAKKYNEWVRDYFNKAEESDKRNLDSDITSGNKIGANGQLPGVRNISSSKDSDPSSLDSLLSRYDVSGQARKVRDFQNQESDLYDEFSKEFILPEGGFNRRIFTETGLQKKPLMEAVLGDEMTKYYSEGGERVSKAEIEQVDSINAKKFISKMKTLQAPEAFRIWQSAKKFIK